MTIILVRIDPPAASGWFTQTNDCGSVLAAKATCTFTVNFAPPGKGRPIPPRQPASAHLPDGSHTITIDSGNGSGVSKSVWRGPALSAGWAGTGQ